MLAINRAPALPLTPEHRATLERWLRAGTTAQRVVLRSRIVLLAADDLPSKYIAQRIGTSQDTVRVWRRRFAALLHESSRARTMPTDRILTCRCDMTRVGRARSSD